MQPLQHLRRFFARHALVQHHTQRVDVRPRPLRIRLHILFDRRVRRCVEGDLGAGRLPGFEAGGSEIDQNRPSSVIDKDIGGFDIAMQYASAMRTIESFSDGSYQIEQLRFGEPAAVTQHLRQGNATLEIHHHVCSAVNFEQTADTDDVRMPVRFGKIPENLRFLDEFLQAEFVNFFGRRIRWSHGGVVDPVAYSAREIFLDRDEFVEIDAFGAIDDAESAHTEHLLQPPLAQYRAVGQCLVMVQLAQLKFAPLACRIISIRWSPANNRAPHSRGEDAI